MTAHATNPRTARRARIREWAKGIFGRHESFFAKRIAARETANDLVRELYGYALDPLTIITLASMLTRVAIALWRLWRDTGIASEADEATILEGVE